MSQPTPQYTIDIAGQLLPHIHQEWLLTNGTGAFAAGTVVGCNTRRYHGLLVAATLPPVGRVMTLSRLGETVSVEGAAPIELSINQFGETFHPRGDRYLKKFSVFDTAKWEYEVDGVKITKELQIVWQKNLAAVRYTVEPGGKKAVEISVLPFVSLRDFHALRRRQGSELAVKSNGTSVSVRDNNLTLHLKADKGTFAEKRDWWLGHSYPVESERGQEDREDLFTPGKFTFSGSGTQHFTILAALDPVESIDWDAELRRRTSQTVTVPSPTQATQRLAHAAADFVVSRKTPEGDPGTTIIAGYPWFADWGRDTMIALPGLLLTTRRFDKAGQVLTVFARYVSDGMIPNLFDDYSNEPRYNTVDASLWFIHAVFEYKRLSKDVDTFESVLLPACRQIIEGYANGTRYGIKMDPEDGLITQGNEKTQLTWMDAKCGEIAFTPRQGKAVEINALWYNALKLMGDEERAKKVEENFAKTFWISPFRGLYDVVNPERKDNAIRPNQIFAASLPFSPLTADQQQAVVEVVRRELLTPVGLRSLSPTDPNFHNFYHGTQFERDRAYHNGTIWAWLIGPFLDAYLKVNRRSTESVEQANRWLQPLIDHMSNQGCIGSISEIFEAEAPYRSVGCFAQAWSIAEVLRLAVDLEM